MHHSHICKCRSCEQQNKIRKEMDLLHHLIKTMDKKHVRQFFINVEQTNDPELKIVIDRVLQAGDTLLGDTTVGICFKSAVKAGGKMTDDQLSFFIYILGKLYGFWLQEKLPEPVFDAYQKITEVWETDPFK